jgi:hypothetical protein
MAPYRESLSRLLTGRELEGAPFYLITYASLAGFYAVAMHSGSIWVPLQFVGATAGGLGWAGLGWLLSCQPASEPRTPIPCCTASMMLFAAGALIAFIFPAWVALGALKRRDPAALASPAYWRLNAWALMALGAVQAVAGVATTLFLNRNQDHDGGGGSGGAASLLFYLF